MSTLLRALRALSAAALALSCAAAWSDDAAIRRNWQLHNPKSPPVDEISKTPIAGLYELRIDKSIVYSDEQGNYFIFPSHEQTDGHLLDARSKTDLTEQRLVKIMAQDVPKLPYGDAVAIKQGNGSRRLIVFEDPNCHYCKDAERNFAALKDVTIYTFLIPILGDDSVAKARQIWCSTDNGKAWRTWMLQGVMPPRAMGRCDLAPLTRNLDLAARYRLNYTPVIIFEDGTRFAGLTDIDTLQKRLDAVAAAAAKKG
jgi:thiol:disulfide interchange protein DsbC